MFISFSWSLRLGQDPEASEGLLNISHSDLSIIVRFAVPLPLITLFVV